LFSGERWSAGGRQPPSPGGASAARIHPNPHGVVTPALQRVEPMDSLESGHPRAREVAGTATETRGLKDLGSSCASPDGPIPALHRTGGRPPPCIPQ
jgi:hypothetical protein